MAPRRSSPALTLGWICAAAGITLAAITWTMKSDTALPTRAQSADPAEARTLRLALESLNRENLVLLEDLKRLKAEPLPFRRTVAEPLPELPEDPETEPTLERGWTTAETPAHRLRLLERLLDQSGSATRPFLRHHIPEAASPEVRAALVDAAARMSTPGHADPFVPIFIDVLNGDSPNAVRVRAVEGLRFARGPAVETALLTAARSSEEAVRLAAVRNLVGRPAVEAELRQILAKEPSRAVRDAGACQVLTSGPDSR